MNLKVCGITDMKQLHQLEGLDIDFAGLIFYRESSLYAGDKISGPELKKADLDIRKVGVSSTPSCLMYSILLTHTELTLCNCTETKIPVSVTT